MCVFGDGPSKLTLIVDPVLVPAWLYVSSKNQANSYENGSPKKPQNVDRSLAQFWERGHVDDLLPITGSPHNTNLGAQDRGNS